jgi:hypothetical protein
MNSKLFLDDIRHVFLPHLSNLRQRPELADEEALLLMDNCRRHVVQDVIDVLTQEGVRVVTFAPRTTNIFQVLDLTVFGVFKRRGQYYLSFETENRAADFIFKTSKDFRRTTINTNMWAAFGGIDLSFHDVGDVQGMVFDEITLTESRGCCELWTTDYRLENLSARRRNAKLGGSTNQSQTVFWKFVRFYQRASEIQSPGKNATSRTSARFTGEMAIIP